MTTTTVPKSRRFDWRLYGVLLGLIIVGLLGVLPYAFTLQAATLASVPLPLPLLGLISVVQGTIL
jgi:hypothetical protein